MIYLWLTLLEGCYGKLYLEQCLVCHSHLCVGTCVIILGILRNSQGHRSWLRGVPLYAIFSSVRYIYLQSTRVTLVGYFCRLIRDASINEVQLNLLHRKFQERVMGLPTSCFQSSPCRSGISGSEHANKHATPTLLPGNRCNFSHTPGS